LQRFKKQQEDYVAKTALSTAVSLVQPPEHYSSQHTAPHHLEELLFVELLAQQRIGR
jgi:hypothetical protein